MGSRGLDGTPACICFMAHIIICLVTIWALSLCEDLPFPEVSVDVSLLINMIWLFCDGVPLISRMPQIGEVGSLILAEVVLPDAHKNSGTSFYLQCTPCGWKGLDLLGTSYQQVCPAAPLPLVSVPALELVLVAFVPLETPVEIKRHCYATRHPLQYSSFLVSALPLPRSNDVLR